MSNESDFDLPPLYDEKLAEEGRDVPVELNGRLYGTFRLKYVDTFNQKNELLYKRVRRKEAIRLKKKEAQLTDLESIRAAVCNIQLIGWDGITRKGEPVEWSVEEAVRFFDADNEITNRILVELAQFANTSANFDVDADDEEDSPAGN